MLSPGTDWRWVPKEYGDNLAYRRYVLDACAASAELRFAVKDLCRRDILFWINTFVYTYDPRTKTKSLPFITWPIQDEAFHVILECVETGQDLVIEKSRDMGGSWISLMAMDWLWLFHPGNTFLMVSRKEDLVDAPGDPDSLFWKLDFVHKNLPEWLVPRITRGRMHFENLDNGSTIDGESTTAAAGVGGRRTAMFIDEFSRIEEGYQLLAGTADTTRCRIFNFTPFGTGNASHKLAVRTDIRKLKLHWKDHPEKGRGLYQYDVKTHRVEVFDKQYEYPLDFQFVMDGVLRSPVYDAEDRRRANRREMAQMWDIDYQGSDYQFFDKATIVDLVLEYARDPGWEGDVVVDPETGKFQGLVKVTGGPLKLWCRLDGTGAPPNVRYGAGADLSMGAGATNSCTSVVNSETGEKVAEYVTPYLRPHEYAPKVVGLCWLFRRTNQDGSTDPAKLAWETQGPGVQFGQRVIELGFRNVYYRVNDQKPFEARTNDIPGWYPADDAKRTVLEAYRAALAARRFLNRSKLALEETLYFINKGKKIEHAGAADISDPTGAGVNHGDRVIADALAWKMVMEINGGLFGLAKQRKIEGQGPAVGSLQWRRSLHEEWKRREEAWA